MTTNGRAFQLGWACAVVIAFFSEGVCSAQEVIAGRDYLKTDAPTSVLFGGADVPSIPAGFFAPNSDPFAGTVQMCGEPLGASYDADTLVRRPSNSTNIVMHGMDTVPIELVALNLVSCQPITVTYNGGQNPQAWNINFDLSVVQSPPGTLTLRKTHSNGGTWDSVLPVQPRFTFIQVSNPSNTRVLDTGQVPLPPIQLQTTNNPWSYTPPSGAPVVTLPGASTNFFPGVQPSGSARQPFTLHSPSNGVVHTVEVASVVAVVPAMREWGLITLAVTLLLSGAVLVRSRAG